MLTMRNRWYTLAAALAVLIGGAMYAVGTAGEPAALNPSETLHLRVGLAERQMYVYVDGRHVETFRVTVGSERHPTPTGDYHISRVIWNPGWVPPDSDWARDEQPTPPGDPANPMGRVKMYFHGPAYYVHGTNDDWSIGWAKSHGCVRMRNEDAITLARLAMQHGGETREPNWFQRVLNRVRDTREVGLSRPIPIEIEPGTPPAPLGETADAQVSAR